MATFVLVPAAWCGGWSWKKVAALLRDGGQEVHTPTPTGLGERVHLAGSDIDLEMHVTDISNVVTFEDLRDVNLVGWSYGGMVIAGVSARIPERIAKLIYLDSVVPANGQSFYAAAEDDGSMRNMYAQRIEAAGTPGFLPFRAEGIEEQLPEEADRAWFLQRVTPHPIATFEQPLTTYNLAVESVEQAYILCTEGKDPDGPDPPYVAQARSDPDWWFHELNANHLAPISAPHATAQVLLGIA